MGQASRTSMDVREIRAPRVALSGGTGRGRMLPVPQIQTLLRVKSSASNDDSLYFEAQNSENAKGKTKLALCQGGQNQWLDYVPSAVMSIVMTDKFCAIGCEDGSVTAYSSAGRQ